jgi:hypothetical protein
MATNVCVVHVVMNGLSDLRTVGSQYMDKPRLGRPSTSRDDAHVAQVREIVRSNRLTVQEMAEECIISIGSCHDSRQN